MNKIFPSIIYLSLVLSACTVGPDFHAPKAPVTASYNGGDELLPTKQHIALGQEIQAEWWTLFASKTLDETIHQAITGNYEIAAAQENLAQAEEAVTAEEGGLLPQLSLEGLAGKQKYGVALFGPSNFKIPPFAYYEAGPSLSWALDIFGGTRRSIERQKALAEYQARQLDATYVTLTGNVTILSFTIAATKAEIAAASEIITEDKKTLQLVQESFQAGTKTKLDVLTAESQLDTDQTLLPPLQQQLSVSRHTLAILLGKAPADYTTPDFELNSFTLPQQLPVSLPSELVRKRPDILAAEANLHAASAAIGVATANLYPNLTLTANTLQESLTPHKIFESASNAWAMAGTITAPIFSGGTLTAQKHQAEHAYQAALAEYRQTILHAFGQVADTLTALQHDSESVAAEQQAVNTASSSLALARTSYQAGNSGILQIQDAGRQLARAKLSLIHAEKQRFLDTAQLFVALGGSPLKK